MTEGDILAAARACLARGWSVIPLRRQEKRPAVRWQEIQQRRPTEAELARWFARWPDANLGIVTGAVSGLVVLDVDPKHGGDDSLAALERAHGRLPETCEALTGGGGRHLYFAHPGGVVHNRAALAPGIDLRGDGGYVVAPPSLHPSGRDYVWEVSRDPDEVPPAPMPRWLLQLATGPGERGGHPLTHWRRLVREGVAEGARNSSIASLTGHLLWHGVDPEVALDLLLCWNAERCRPPLDADEVARTVESIRRLHEREATAGAAAPPQR
jgi:hypothetical protein